MPGLTNATSGLSYGVGLIYPIVPENLTSMETFMGAGTMSVSTRMGVAAPTTFGGAGGMSVLATIGVRGAARFAGAGSLQE